MWKLSLLVLMNMNMDVLFGREKIIQYSIESSTLNDVLFASSSENVDDFLDKGYTADGEVFYLSSEPCPDYDNIKQVRRFIAKNGGENHVLQNRDPSVVKSWIYEETIGYCYSHGTPYTVPIYVHTSLDTFDDLGHRKYIYNLNQTPPPNYGKTRRFCYGFDTDHINDCPTDSKGFEYNYYGKYVTIYDPEGQFEYVASSVQCDLLADGPASIHSEQDQQDAVKSIKREWIEILDEYDCPFIGGIINNNGEFHWFDGSDFDFEYFSTAEPKDAISTNLLTVYVGCGPAGEWFTLPQQRKKSSTIICNHNQQADNQEN